MTDTCIQNDNINRCDTACSVDSCGQRVPIGTLVQWDDGAECALFAKRLCDGGGGCEVAGGECDDCAVACAKAGEGGANAARGAYDPDVFTA